MIYIFKIIIIVVTFQVASVTPPPCEKPEVFYTRFDTLTVFEGNCPSCANAVYSQCKANLWKLQGDPMWRVIIDVKRDSLEVEP